MVAALAPKMLELAATLADGTVTWMTGIATLRDYIVPTITKAAADAGRPAPEVIASLPVCCTSDVPAAIERINTSLAIYPTLPSYKAMLDKEGATGPADVALIGSKDQIVDALGQLACRRGDRDGRGDPRHPRRAGGHRRGPLGVRDGVAAAC